MIEISDQFTLRSITPEDQIELHQLMKDIYIPVYHHLWKDDGKSYIDKVYGRPQLSAELQQPNSLYCFVQYNSVTIGIIRLLEDEPHEAFKNQVAAKLQRIYLGDAAQGKGIGKALMGWLEKRAQQQGASVFWLEVMETQKSAIKFYEKLGFINFNNVRFTSDQMHDKFKGMFQMWKPIDSVEL